MTDIKKYTVEELLEIAKDVAFEIDNVDTTMREWFVENVERILSICIDPNTNSMDDFKLKLKKREDKPPIFISLSAVQVHSFGTWVEVEYDDDRIYTIVKELNFDLLQRVKQEERYVRHKTRA